MGFSLFDNSKVLVTGGTGSFGKEFTRRALSNPKLKRLIIYSRDEMKQYEMAKEFSDPRIRFFIGDVRDKERLSRAFNGVDYVVHAAALKIVPTAEYNPFEYIKTNIHGAMNIIDVAIDRGVKKVVALSTDKAANPVNLYGATKLCSDKLFIAGNSYTGTDKTKFAVVRYGNVVGSRGSVIPFFRELINQGKTTLPITDERMTRFLISLPEAVDLVETAFVETAGGEIFVKKVPSVKITDVAKAFGEQLKTEIIGIRPGEKLHEVLISDQDSDFTYEYDTYYKILPAIYQAHLNPERQAKGKKVEVGFEYNSLNNRDWLPFERLKELVDAH